MEFAAGKGYTVAADEMMQKADGVQKLNLDELESASGGSWVYDFFAACGIASVGEGIESLGKSLLEVTEDLMSTGSV